MVEVEADWGEIVPNEALLDALEAHSGRAARRGRPRRDVDRRRAIRSRSSGAAHARRRDALLIVDCVTSLGGIPLEFDAWGFDYAYSCTQKCLAAPPGMSPVAISDRALERIAARETPVPFSFDLDLLRALLGRPAGRPTTTRRRSSTSTRCTRRCAASLDEGLEDRFQRHADAGGYLQEQVRSRGLELLADPDYQLAQLTARPRPRGRRRQGRPGAACCRSTASRSAAGSAPTRPPIWRLGLMGHNARRDAADQVLAALDAVLADTKQLASTA